MNYHPFKKLITFFGIILVVTVLNISHAQTVSSVCGAGLDLSGPNPPSPLKIICPIVRVFNVAVLAAGAIFVAMVIYGAIKLALSLGDPKGFQGAQQTWFWAVIGLAVVLGFYTVILIMDKMLGLGIATGGPDSVFNAILSSVGGLLGALGVTGYN